MAAPDPVTDICSAGEWPAGRVLVVAATYAERANIPALVQGVLAADPTVQLLIVDDDSPDGTAEAALAAARHEPRLHVLVRKGRRGLGSAILANPEGYKNVRRPIWPLDQAADTRPGLIF